MSETKPSAEERLRAYAHPRHVDRSQRVITTAIIEACAALLEKRAADERKRRFKSAASALEHAATKLREVLRG